MNVSIDLGNALMGVGLIASAVMSFLAWWQARRNHALALDTHELVNGQSEMLRTNAHDSGYAQGIKDQRAEDKK